MKLMLKTIAVAAIVTFAATKPAVADIPVTISATIAEACSLGTDNALLFAFGDVAAQGAAPVKVDGVALTCSDGVDYHFSTADGTESNFYTLDVGAQTGAAKVTLTVAAQSAGTTGPGLPSSPPSCEDPTDLTTCGFEEEAAGDVALMTTRTGTGAEETIDFTALLEDAAVPGKAPASSGAVAGSETLYIVY